MKSENFPKFRLSTNVEISICFQDNKIVGVLKANFNFQYVFFSLNQLQNLQIFIELRYFDVDSFVSSLNHEIAFHLIVFFGMEISKLFNLFSSSLSFFFNHTIFMWHIYNNNNMLLAVNRNIRFTLASYVYIYTIYNIYIIRKILCFPHH